jgi:hypothetical protein
MHFPCRKFLHQSPGAAAPLALRTARPCSFLLTTCIALLAGSPAHADSKAAAEFTLKTCTDAMADFAKVQATARASGWSVSPQPLPDSAKKYLRELSIWNVPQGDDTYTLSIGEFGLEQKGPPTRLCFIGFFGHATVKRNEFFNRVSAAMDLRLLDDKRTTMRTERYEARLYLPKKIHFSIMSTLDGMVANVSMREITLPAPATKPDELLIRPRFDSPVWPRGDH